ncbi:MAG TPA: hypothetical protein VJ801_06865, partial [Polyangia bacterium]|nr:hypothetical protein [Polyangia bacterium]
MSTETDSNIIRNQVRIYTCESWEDFFVRVRRDIPLPIEPDSWVDCVPTIFRGHSNPEWKLMSRFERRTTHYTPPDHEGKRTALSLRTGRGVSSYTKACVNILAEFRRLSNGM